MPWLAGKSGVDFPRREMVPWKWGKITYMWVFKTGISQLGTEYGGGMGEAIGGESW